MNQLLEEGEARGLVGHGREALRLACERALEPLRERLRSGEAVTGLDDGFWPRVEAALAVVPGLRLRRALNATGVVLHTNLGRAPWADEAVAAASAASGAALVEIDRATGRRGRRDAAVGELLARLTGAEAGLPVNNNAGAVLLALSALARGRKVAVARGELVEIGGSYRMPEVVAAAGAEMVALGTTNRVHLADFERALADPEVACVLRVHPSNFRIEGFTGAPGMAELAALCREHGVPLVYDLGSGVLAGQELPALSEEHPVGEAVAAGCDLVTFSGDKLLGGPQAGLVVGAAPLVERLRRDVLTRCLRLDKTILAALEATLALHALGPEAARRRIPALARLHADADELERRARAFAAALEASGGGWRARVVPAAGRVGSGASPTADLPGWGVHLTRPGASGEALAAELRALEPPVFGRVQDDGVLLDLRTLSAEEEQELLLLLGGRP